MNRNRLIGTIILALMWGCGPQARESGGIPDNSFSFAFLTDNMYNPSWEPAMDFNGPSKK